MPSWKRRNTRRVQARVGEGIRGHDCRAGEETGSAVSTAVEIRRPSEHPSELRHGTPVPGRQHPLPDGRGPEAGHGGQPLGHLQPDPASGRAGAPRREGRPGRLLQGPGRGSGEGRKRQAEEGSRRAAWFTETNRSPGAIPSCGPSPCSTWSRPMASNSNPSPSRPGRSGRFTGTPNSCSINPGSSSGTSREASKPTTR